MGAMNCPPPPPPPAPAAVAVGVVVDADDELEAADDGPMASRGLKTPAGVCWPQAPRLAEEPALLTADGKSGLSLESGELRQC